MRRDVILVPRRDDEGYRDELWAWCRAWWEREQSHMPIIEGYHVEGLFNRSAAINRAAKLAGDWDVAVIIDADVICDPNRVKEACDLAHETGSAYLPHGTRYDLSQRVSEQVRRGLLWPDSSPQFVRRHVRHTYNEANGHPSVSSVLVISRRQWDEIGGFDEQFRGWGFEDTAFAAACETFGGLVRMDGEVWHFWHPTAREGKRGTESWSRNSALGQQYRTAIGNPEEIRRLQGRGRWGAAAQGGSTPSLTIPRILHRTVPAEINLTAEGYWEHFEQLHPDWQLMTHRDPLDPDDWPLTFPHWGKTANGAQFADLIRLEALVRWGGVYVDQDVECVRPFDPLLSLPAFAAWEDERCVPNAVMGATPQHPAVLAALDEMIRRLPGDTWQAGPGVLTDLWPGRSDVLLLPPGSFYPVHYRDPDRDNKLTVARAKMPGLQPWCFAVHHYWGSWLPEKRRRVPA